MKEIYSSKWHRIVKFLHGNIGLKIAGVSPKGSQAKGTSTRKSDLDVIFCTSLDRNKKSILNLILQKARNAFGKVVNVNRGKKAVHIDFIKPKCEIDVVYLTKNEFNSACKNIKTIRRISQLQKNSIILAKYAFDKAKVKEVEGHQIEKACLHFNYDTLADYTCHNIKHFTDKIARKGLKLDSVLRYLI